MANPLYQKHIISINDLSRDDLNLVLATAAKLKANPQPELLKHKVIASCFFEASTRTRLSFETSMHRLGASVVGFSDSANTSLGKKGETLADTISVISTYVDAIVMRHPQEGAARLATEFSGNVPVLNAGDGSNQHPTQTLLDLFTIKETQGRLDNLHVAMVGDLKYGRTVHSLTQALAKFDGNRFYFIAPDALAMPQYILDMLDEKGIAWSLHSAIEEVMAEVDILYMTRVQKERLDPSEYANVKAQFVLRASDLHNAKANMKVLHPLPRVDEIATDVDKTLGEERFVSGIYGCEVVQIFHKNGGFNDIAHFQASRFHDRFYVIQRLTRLCGYVCRNFARFRVYRDLTGGDDHTAQINALNIRTDSCGCIFRRDSFAHDFSFITAVKSLAHYREPDFYYQPQLIGQHHIMGKLFFAVFAFERDIIGAFSHCKAGRNRFGMADTVAVRADQHIVDALWQTGARFANHFIVVDTVYRGLRCIQCQLVYLIFTQKGIFDFDQILAPHLARRQVQTNGDALIRFGQLEQTQQLKTDLGGDMVNYRAAFNSFNLQFIIVCHLYFPLQYQIAIQNQCQ